MIYVLYWHKFELSGAIPDQFSFDKYESKKDFIDYLIKILEENREAIHNLDGEEAEEDLENITAELQSNRDKEDIESISLSDLEWECGSFYLKICFAEYFPKVLKGFRKIVLENSDGLFDEYVGLTAAEKRDYEDDENYELYKAIYKINKNSSEVEFDQTFAMLMDGLGSDSVF